MLKVNHSSCASTVCYSYKMASGRPEERRKARVSVTVAVTSRYYRTWRVSDTFASTRSAKWCSKVASGWIVVHKQDRLSLSLSLCLVYGPVAARLSMRHKNKGTTAGRALMRNLVHPRRDQVNPATHLSLSRLYEAGDAFAAEEEEICGGFARDLSAAFIAGTVMRNWISNEVRHNRFN